MIIDVVTRRGRGATEGSRGRTERTRRPAPVQIIPAVMSVWRRSGAHTRAMSGRVATRAITGLHGGISTGTVTWIIPGVIIPEVTGIVRTTGVVGLTWVAGLYCGAGIVRFAGVVGATGIAGAHVCAARARGVVVTGTHALLLIGGGVRGPA